MTNLEKLLRISSGLREEAKFNHNSALLEFLDAKVNVLSALCKSDLTVEGLEGLEEGLKDAIANVQKAIESLKASENNTQIANEIERNPNDFEDEIDYYERFLK